MVAGGGRLVVGDSVLMEWARQGHFWHRLTCLPGMMFASIIPCRDRLIGSVGKKPVVVADVVGKIN